MAVGLVLFSVVELLTLPVEYGAELIVDYSWLHLHRQRFFGNQRRGDGPAERFVQHDVDHFEIFLQDVIGKLLAFGYVNKSMGRLIFGQQID